MTFAMSRRRRTRRITTPGCSNERGFTLAEMMVAVTASITTLLGVYAIQQQAFSTYLMGAARVEAQADARAALDLIIHELRYATAVTTVTGCNSGTSDITFVSLDDQDPTQTVTLRYQLSGTNLQRTKAGTMTVLIGGVQNLTFTCYDANGAPTATAASVRTIIVSLRTRPQSSGATYTPANQQVVMQGEARLRNFP